MQVNLSFSDGIEVDRNTSRRLLQRLRLALHKEEAPDITGFDPRFNQSQPLWCAAIIPLKVVKPNVRSSTRSLQCPLRSLVVLPACI